MELQIVNEETMREITWNLCKLFDVKNQKRSKVRLNNFVTLALELRFGPVVENLYQIEWQDEVLKFCEKYKYLD